MLELKRILFPIDFSAQCVAAADHARRLAEPRQAEIVLIHVLAPVMLIGKGADISGSMAVEWYQTQRPLLEEKLAAFRNDHLQGCRVRTDLREGDTAAEIVKAASEAAVDLVLMPTHARGAFRRFILGSVTAKVLHDSPVPVLTLAHMLEPVAKGLAIRKILAAIDLEPNSEKVLQCAHAVAKMFDATLTVTHALPAPSDAAESILDPAWRLDLETFAVKKIDELLAGEGIEAQIEVEAGEPAKAVRNVARRLGSDLLVIGRHMEPGILGRLRTHAYAIVREAPCPVLSV